MAEVKIQIDNEKLRILIPQMPGVRAKVLETAGEIVFAAQLLALFEAFETGRYMRGITLRETSDEGVQAVATDFKSHWIEDGTIKQYPKHIMRRAAESVSLNA